MTEPTLDGADDAVEADNADSAVESAPVGSRRPGGRAARVRTAVLDATMTLLIEQGLDAVAIDEVARRAGVHKTTVYRRWPDRAELVLDAVLEASGEIVPVPDTGSLVDDLRLFARSVAANLTDGPGLAVGRAMVVTAAGSPEMADTLARYWSERFAMARLMFERAEARGELVSPPAGGVDLAIEQLIGPLWVRVLLTGRPVDQALADASAAAVARGLER